MPSDQAASAQEQPQQKPEPLLGQAPVPELQLSFVAPGCKDTKRKLRSSFQTHRAEAQAPPHRTLHTDGKNSRSRPVIYPHQGQAFSFFLPVLKASSAPSPKALRYFAVNETQPKRS